MNLDSNKLLYMVDFYFNYDKVYTRIVYGQKRENCSDGKHSRKNIKHEVRKFGNIKGDCGFTDDYKV